MLVDVNPNLTKVDFPNTWTKYSFTVAGLTNPVEAKFGFRYFVTNGGPGQSAPNSDIIGIDTFSVDRPTMATNNFITDNYKIYLNPATNVINVVAKTGSSINQTEITDINGRIVKSTTPKALQSEINISELTSGVYFVKVVSELGAGSTKFVKQ